CRAWALLSIWSDNRSGWLGFTGRFIGCIRAPGTPRAAGEAGEAAGSATQTPLEEAAGAPLAFGAIEAPDREHGDQQGGQAHLLDLAAHAARVEQRRLADPVHGARQVEDERGPMMRMPRPELRRHHRRRD